MAEPVSPPTVSVADIATLVDELGLAAAPAGASTYELRLQNGLVADVQHDPTVTRPAHMAVCASSVTQARQALQDHYGHPASPTDTIDSETLRSRGVLIQTPSLVVTGIHCPAAETLGVPCSPECSPSMTP